MEDLNSLGIKKSSNLGEKVVREAISGEYKDLVFEDPLCIQDIILSGDQEKLVFDNCEFRKLSLKKVLGRNVHFINCKIGNFEYYNSGVDALVFERCAVDNVIFNKSKEVKNVRILDSRCGRIDVFNSILKLVEIISMSEIGEIKFDYGAGVDKIAVGMSKIDTLVSDNMPEFDIKSGAIIQKLQIQAVRFKELWKRYRLEKKEGVAGLKRLSMLVLALYSSYIERNMFSESDQCLYILRDVNMYLRIKQTGKKLNKFGAIAKPLIWLVKMLYAVAYFTIGKCFGWGIRITNNLISMLVSIFAFSSIYIALSDTDTVKGVIGDSFMNSLKYFFNLDVVYKDLPSAMLYAAYAESILGIFLLTIITGVVVRKIVK